MVRLISRFMVFVIFSLSFSFSVAGNDDDKSSQDGSGACILMLILLHHFITENKDTRLKLAKNQMEYLRQVSTIERFYSTEREKIMYDLDSTTTFTGARIQGEGQEALDEIMQILESDRWESHGDPGEVAARMVHDLDIPQVTVDQVKEDFKIKWNEKFGDLRKEVIKSYNAVRLAYQKNTDPYLLGLVQENPSLYFLLVKDETPEMPKIDIMPW